MSLEVEIARQQAYETWWSQEAHQYLCNLFKDKQYVKKLLIRYLFVKLIDAKPDEDAVFQPHYSELALKMMEGDISFLHKKGIHANKVVSTLDKFLLGAMQDVQQFQATNNQSLNVSDPQQASWKRYEYLQLDTMGLAVPFQQLGYKPSDPVLECFASSYNKYFDKWCSAFPDVDVDSIGNFFQLLPSYILKINVQVLMVNPPYDVIFCEQVFDYCMFLLEHCEQISILMILPDWPKWPALEAIQQKCWKTVAYSKQSSSFIQHQSSNKMTINACKTVWLYLGKERKVTEQGTIEFD